MPSSLISRPVDLDGLPPSHGPWRRITNLPPNVSTDGKYGTDSAGNIYANTGGKPSLPGLGGVWWVLPANNVVTPAAQSFRPTDVSGCKLWIFADSLSTLADATAVTNWYDYSLNLNHVSGIGTARPVLKQNIVNGHCSVRFDGSNDIMTIGASMASAASSTFIVCAMNTTAALQSAYAAWIVTGSTVGSPRVNCTLSSTNWGYWNSSDQSAGEILVNGTWNLLEQVTASGTNNTFLYRNGAQKLNNSTQPSSGGSGQQSIGGESGFTRFVNGDIAELIIYNVALSAADRAAVESYLGTKYGLF